MGPTEWLEDQFERIGVAFGGGVGALRPMVQVINDHVPATNCLVCTSVVPDWGGAMRWTPHEPVPPIAGTEDR